MGALVRPFGCVIISNMTSTQKLSICLWGALSFSHKEVVWKSTTWKPYILPLTIKEKTKKVHHVRSGLLLIFMQIVLHQEIWRTICNKVTSHKELNKISGTYFSTSGSRKLTVSLVIQSVLAIITNYHYNLTREPTMVSSEKMVDLQWILRKSMKRWNPSTFSGISTFFSSDRMVGTSLKENFKIQTGHRNF